MSGQHQISQPPAVSIPTGLDQLAEHLINRELSWLEFNARVLALADDEYRPLLERAKFLAIFSSNLDEFYQVRFGGLLAQERQFPAKRSQDGLTASQQLQLIRRRVRELLARHAQIYQERFLPALAAAGIRISPWQALDDAARHHLGAWFDNQILPVLTPLSVDNAHPFPYISNLSLNLAVVVRDPVTEMARFARLKVPSNLPRLVDVYHAAGERPASGEQLFVPLEEVIAAHLDELFPGMQVESFHSFRVTRHADLEFEGTEAEDLLEAIEAEIRRRRRSEPAVRLEIDSSAPPEVISLLTRELELSAHDVYRSDIIHDLTCLWQLHELDRPDLKEQPWVPRVPPIFDYDPATDPGRVFAILRHGDVMVHHPYESFSATVESFIESAARDPDVLAIKQTLYRTSEGENPIVRALTVAAESGKQVVALVELKARFDEVHNINWARTLEEAGVHVVYGLVGLKTHAKVTLVVRREGDHIRRYFHASTGNYNRQTAAIYEDIGLLSADPELAQDCADLFNYLTGYSRHTDYHGLIVAPLAMRERLVEMIGQEAERPGGGRIVIKGNNLVDVEIIQALYRASQAGVQVDLIIRGVCCLKPGVPGLSENIRVRSIVGRYLEHSRIYRFGPDGDASYYIGSADLMHRNLSRRVEILVPVRAAALRQRLGHVLDLCLTDEALAWTLHQDRWVRLRGRPELNVQRSLEEMAADLPMERS